MKIVCWNVRGLGNPRTVRELKEVLRRYEPHVVFLSETRLTVKHSDVLKYKLHFSYLFSVTRNRFGGGLALVWKEDNDMTILSYSKYNIDTVITNGDELLRFTGICGHPEQVEKRHTWTLLRRLAQLSLAP